jgi:uncharacterized protein
MADCGSCNLCCKLLNVPDINKPSGMLCWWTTVHGGCSRHKEKSTAPELEACGQFMCLWLASQRQPDPGLVQGRAMRPDVCHVVIGPDVEIEGVRTVFVQVDPDFPSAWQHPRIASYLDRMKAVGVKVDINVGAERWEYAGNGMAVAESARDAS